MAVGLSILEEMSKREDCHMKGSDETTNRQKLDSIRWQRQSIHVLLSCLIRVRRDQKITVLKQTAALQHKSNFYEVLFLQFHVFLPWRA